MENKKGDRHTSRSCHQRFVKIWWKVFLPSVVFTILFCSLSLAQTANKIAKDTFPSVVLLVMEDDNKQLLSLGSGFFVGDGIIATNRHVTEGAVSGYAKVIGQEAKYDIAGIVAVDDTSDLILLALPGAKAPPLPLGNSEQVAIGDEIYVVGNPIGLEGTFSKGIVSSIRRFDSDSIFQITAPISPGSSGGPVLNDQGHVIGIAAATFEGGQNLNFALPSAYLKSLLSEVKSPAPLGAYADQKKSRSRFADLGEPNTTGVVGTQFLWEYPTAILPTGSYSFSIHNRLSVPVKKIDCLIIFYDTAGEPIEADRVATWSDEIIMPGLAKRVSGRMYEVDGSVQKLSSRVEIRVLDFELVT